MPHAIVKLQSGGSEQQKARIAEEVTHDPRELRGASRLGDYRRYRAE
jgi:phenylpyruvate tautomerase PptA (4-oxalocrotonate tautomerase family)